MSMEKELNIVEVSNPFLNLRDEESHCESGSSTTLPSHNATFIWEEYVIEQKLVPILTGTNKKKMIKYLTNQIELCDKDIKQAESLATEYHNIIYCRSKHEEFWTDVCRICFLDPLTVNQNKIIKRNRYLLSVLEPATNTETGVNQQQIAKAKDYPLTDLIEFNKNHTAICPFHNERTGSLHYYKKSNTAYCFGACQKSYDSIEVYKLLNHCSFVEAVRKLNN